MKRCVVCGKNNRDFVSLEFAWFGPNLCNICAFKCKGLSLWQPFPVIGRQRLFKVNETILRKAV